MAHPRFSSLCYILCFPCYFAIALLLCIFCYRHAINLLSRLLKRHVRRPPGECGVPLMSCSGHLLSPWYLDSSFGKYLPRSRIIIILTKKGLPVRATRSKMNSQSRILTTINAFATCPTATLSRLLIEKTQFSAKIQYHFLPPLQLRYYSKYRARVDLRAWGSPSGQPPTPHSPNVQVAFESNV